MLHQLHRVRSNPSTKVLLLVGWTGDFALGRRRLVPLVDFVHVGRNHLWNKRKKIGVAPGAKSSVLC